MEVFLDSFISVQMGMAFWVRAHVGPLASVNILQIFKLLLLFGE